MTTKLHDNVRAFHKRFGHPVRDVPTIPSDEEIRFRLKLITEEYRELFDSVFHGRFTFVSDAFETIEATIAHGPIRVDLPELVDAMADLEYVIEGTRAVCGVNGEPIHDAVQTSNMGKKPVLIERKCTTVPQCIACDRLGYHLEPDPTAKPTKPDGWKAPMIEALLLEQGWKKTTP